MKKVLDIETVHKAGRNLLAKAYAAHPYKVADITEDKKNALRKEKDVLDSEKLQIEGEMGNVESSISDEKQKRKSVKVNDDVFLAGCA